jgi:hypothetical protein
LHDPAECLAQAKPAVPGLVRGELHQSLMSPTESFESREHAAVEHAAVELPAPSGESEVLPLRTKKFDHEFP